MSKTSAIVFFSIVGVGAVISVITLNLLGEKEEVTDPEPRKLLTVDEEEPFPEEEKKEPKKKTETAKTGTPDKPDEKPEPVEEKPAGFDSPEAAMKALAEKVEAKDFSGFEEVAGKDAIPDSIRSEIKSIVENPKLKIDEKKPFREISKSADSVRWVLNFVPGEEVAASELFADLSQTETKKIDIAKLSLPLDPGKVTKSADGDSPEPSQSPDALSIALAFSEAIIDREFEIARALADPSTVTDERIAALMIALEEGGFHLREDRPLVVTLSRDDITWILTRVQAEKEGSEFAVELGRVDEDWKVNGLTFSKVISLLADKSGAGDVAYSPIVEDPEGGDSLVLYFEFDQAGVTPRASRQLAIVADILSKGGERVIRINGHADALGTDDYNKGLSNNRADSIRKALISMGVSPEQIITESFGETKPRSPNFNPDGTDNPAGRSKNRRAEVYLDF